MKHLSVTVAGLSLVALAWAPALAGDQRPAASDTQQQPPSARDRSVTTEPTADPGSRTNTGAGTPTPGSGSVSTDSPSASPPAPGATGTTDSPVNPSQPTDTPPSGSTRGTSEREKSKD